MGASDTARHYDDDVIDISDDAHRYIHEAECIRGLPALFDNMRRPSCLPPPALTRS